MAAGGGASGGGRGYDGFMANGRRDGGGDVVSDPAMPDAARRPAHFLDELRATFASRSGRPAVVHQDRTYTYGELEARALRCAARMRRLGLEPGDRVAIVTTDKLPF